MHPPTNMTPPSDPSSGATSFVETFIPSNNGNALLSYYLGIFSIIPCFGLVMGIVAFITGRKALKTIKDDPRIKGGTHAKVGIGCGLIGFVFNAIIMSIALAVFIEEMSKKK